MQSTVGIRLFTMRDEYLPIACSGAVAGSSLKGGVSLTVSKICQVGKIRLIKYTLFSLMCKIGHV